jgi:hypothetical protein
MAQHHKLPVVRVSRISHDKSSTGHSMPAQAYVSSQPYCHAGPREAAQWVVLRASGSNNEASLGQVSAHLFGKPNSASE